MDWRKVISRAFSKDVAMFVSGLALTINEALQQPPMERPMLLGLYAAMMGLPAILMGSRKGGGDGAQS